MNRKSTLSLFANAQIPSCPNAIQEKIFYIWDIYKGTSFVSSLVSTSRDPRFFKLNSYSLESSSIYTARVTVYAASAPTETSSASVQIQVGKLGVKALIAGGSARTVSSEDELISLDASSSYDIDYPSDITKITSYTWTCVEISPNFGELCSFMDSSNKFNMLTIPGVNIAAAEIKKYLFTVFVKNAVGSSSSATTEMTVLSKSIPSLLMRTAASKYNSDTKIILSASITNTENSYIKWFSTNFDDVDLIPLLVTPIDMTITTVGVTVYQLAIAANSLTPGLTYTFQIGASYDADLNQTSKLSLFESISEISISINEAPKDGSMVVSPAIGEASTTVFLLSTQGWSDDDDTIFKYVISYYVISPETEIVVKNKDFPLFVESKLGQGLEISGYAVTCSVIAYDSLDSASTPSTTIITVKPNTNSTQLALAAKKDLENALIDNNPEVVSQVTGAVTSSINAVNCTIIGGFTCVSRNREECSTVANTCGNCLADFPTGASRASNSKCYSKSNALTRRKLISSVGANCTSDDECLSGNCIKNVCSYLPKTCPSDCSGNGDCIAYNYYNNVIDNANCLSNNRHCIVSCKCNISWYGNDCSQTLEELNNVRILRETLAKSLFDTVAIQDVTVDVVISRAINIANILIDSSELSNNTLIYCAQTLINTINSYPELAGSPAAFKITAAALSSLLNSVTNSTLINDISNTLKALTSGIQSTLAVGENAVELIDENIRLVTSVVTGLSLSTLTYSSPVEVDEIDDPTTINFNTSTDNNVYLTFYSLTLGGGVQSEVGADLIVVPEALPNVSFVEGEFASNLVNVNVDISDPR